MLDGSERQLDEEETPHRCQKCAGLCCVIPSIEAEGKSTFSKTWNRVCEFLDLKPSWLGHACSIYIERRYRRMDACRFFDCLDIGPAATNYLLAKNAIEKDGTVTAEGVDVYDTFLRIAREVDFESNKFSFTIIPLCPKAAFIRHCEAVLERFLKDSVITLPNGEESTVEKLREWYFEGREAHFWKVFGIIPIGWLFKKNRTER